MASPIGGDGVQAVLDAVAAHEMNTRQQPTIRELAQAMGVTVDTAHKRVLKAVADGVLEHQPGIPRSIRVAGKRCELCGR